MLKSLRVAAVAAVFCVLALAAQAQSLAGAYTMSGTDPDGGAYTGAVTVAQTGAGLTITWEIDGKRTFGAALSVEKVLAIGSVLDGKSIVQLMVEKGDGTIEGVWYQRGEAKTGTEVWKKK